VIKGGLEREKGNGMTGRRTSDHEIGETGPFAVRLHLVFAFEKGFGGGEAPGFGGGIERCVDPVVDRGDFIEPVGRGESMDFDQGRRQNRTEGSGEPLRSKERSRIRTLPSQRKVAGVTVSTPSRETKRARASPSSSSGAAA
jgi:hypothetical protein